MLWGYVDIDLSVGLLDKINLTWKILNTRKSCIMRAQHLCARYAIFEEIYDLDLCVNEMKKHI